jgi:hypothetical protein
VLEAGDARSANAFLDSYGLTGITPDGRMIVDVAGQIAGRIGLNMTPVGFRVENGVLASATTVPSSRYLTSILPEPIRLKQAG